MSKRDDLLFCKIAITSGLVSEEQARKVLAICDKKEREDGRRPLIGAVFAKYNLISSPHVKKVYEAVNKRTGGQAGTATRVKSPTAGRARRGGPHARRGGRQRKPSQGVDPGTLWMGIGSGAVFIVIIFVVIYLFNRAETGGGSGVASGSASASGSGSGSGRATPVAAPTPEPSRTPQVRAELPQDVEHELRSAIGDARRDLGENPERGLAMVRDWKAKLTGQYAPYDSEKLYRELVEVEAQLEAAAAGESDPAPDSSVDSGSTGAGEPAGDVAAEGTAAQEPAVEEEDAEPADGAGEAEGDGLDFLDDF